jgi:hypothetical protein
MENMSVREECQGEKFTNQKLLYKTLPIEHILNVVTPSIIFHSLTTA